MSVQDRISPYNIDTISSKQVMRIKKKYQLQDYKLIQYQILQTNIIELYVRQKGELLMRSWESKDEYTVDWCYYL